MVKSSNMLSSMISGVRSRLNRSNAPYIALVLVALIIRLWELGARTMHYDECVHINCARGFFTNPLPWCLQGWTHGPFQFEGTAFFYLFGTNDITSRLLPVVFGTAIVALPYFLRRQLGYWGSIIVTALLAFSPLLMFYSRYGRNDIYIAFFMLLVIVCLWRYIEDRKARYLYIGAAALSLSFGTKEVSFITVAIIGIFLLVLSAKELALRCKNKFDLSGLSAPAEFLILIVTLALPLFAPFINIILPGDGLGRYLLTDHWGSVALLVFLFAAGAVIGLRWNWRRWVISALIFWGIYILMYTVFFTKMSYLDDGIWETIAYWITQHEVERGGQPEFYYLMVVPVYEFLPVTFATVGAIYYTLKENLIPKLLLCGAALGIILYAFLGLGNSAQSVVIVVWSALCTILYVHFGKANLFTRFLIYWAALTLILYSYFGEKMPWLSVHVALPTIVFAGMFIGRVVKAFNWRRWTESALSKDMSLVSVFLGLIFVIVAIWMTIFASSIIGWIVTLFIVGFFLIAVGAFNLLKQKWVKPWMAQAGIAFVLLVMGSLTMYDGLYESYHTSDTPPKMLIYCGISEDVSRIAEKIYSYSDDSGLGAELPIVVYGSGLYDIGWRWYLREYRNTHHSLDYEAGPPEGAVLLLGEKEKLVGNESWRGNYDDGEQIKTHIWYPERGCYKPWKEGDIWYGFNQSWYLNYLFRRDSYKPYWTSNAWVYFPTTSQ